MRRPSVKPGFWIVPLILALWGVAFTLACWLTSLPPEGISTEDERDSATLKALGATRVALGNRLFEEADRTFHMGVGVYRRAAFTNGFVRLGRAITPEGHVHLRAEGVNELAPWLYFATRANPHNVEAYIVAAFWLAGEGGRPDLAARVLDEARSNNPRNYRVYLEKGRLALKNDNAAEAARAFDAALRLWESDSGTDKVQARLDRAEMSIYRGLLFENNGEITGALNCYGDMLKLFPERSGIRERVAELTATGRARAAPADVWRTIMFQRRHVCEREEHQPSSIDHKP